MAYGLRIINDASDLLVDSEFVNPTFVQKMEFNITPTYTEASDGRQHPGFIRRNYSTGYVAKGAGTYIVLWALPDSIASGPEKDVWYQFTTSEATNNLSFDCSVYANSQGSPIAYSLPTAYVFTIDAAGVNLMSSTGPALRMYNSLNVKTFDSNFLQLLPTYVSNNYSIPQGEQYTPLYMALTMVTAIFLLPKTALMFAGDIGNGFSAYKVFDVVYRRRGQYLDTRTMSTSYQEEDSTIGSPLIIFPAGTFDNLTVIAADGNFYQASDASTQPGLNPTYTLTRSAASVNEGSAFTITLTVTNATVLNGTSIGYNVTGVQGSLDFTASATSFIVNNNTSSVTFTVLNDTLTEGTEIFLLELTTSPYPTISVTINDTSLSAPVYSISPQTGSVNEGGSVIFTVTTANVVNGTTLYWAYRSGSSDPGSDFNAYNGSFTITSNSGSFVVYPIADTLTEGSETFAVGVRTGSTTGLEVATTGTFTINDTSISTPTHSFTSVQNVTETQTSNSVAIFTFTNVVNKTVTFAIVAPSSGATATPGTDVTLNITSMNINGSSFREVSYYPTADQITEGTEFFRITATIDGLVVATSSNISISDTSTYPVVGTLLSTSCESYGVAPYTLLRVYANGNGGTYTEGTYNSPTCGYVAPTYSLARSTASVNEGGSFTITFTSNQSGSYFGYTITGVESADINGASLTGTVTNGSVLTYSVTADNSTEGTQYFTITLNNNQATTNVTINDTSINYPGYGTVLSQGCVAYGTSPYTYRVTKADGSGGSFNEDTNNSTSCGYVAPTYSLTASAGSVNEGGSVTFYVGGSNIPNGTYYWQYEALYSPAAVANDLTPYYGYVSVSSNSGSFTITAVADSQTEGAEYFVVRLYSQSGASLLATSSSVTINDNSTTPIATTPTWQFHRTVGSINWTVPTGRTVVTFMVVGGGAGGRSVTGGGGGGGAGGTSYNIDVPVTPGQVLTFTVGAGGGSNSNGSQSSVTGLSSGSIISGGGGTGSAGSYSSGGTMGSGNYVGSNGGGGGAGSAGGGGGGIGGEGYSATAQIAGDGGDSFPLFDGVPPGPFNICGGGGGAGVEGGIGGTANNSGGPGAGAGGTYTNNGGNAVDHGGGGGGAKSGGTGGSGFRGMIAWYG